MSAGVPFDSLPPEVQKDLIDSGQVVIPRAPRKVSMTKDAVRGHAIRVLAAVAGLSQSDRARVLEQAAKVNDL